MRLLQLLFITFVMLGACSCASKRTPVASSPLGVIPQPGLFVADYPDIRPVDSTKNYELREDWEVVWHGKRVAVPMGYQYDGASVPRWLWSITGLTPDGLMRLGALPHDWVYDHAGIMDTESFTRLEADQMMFDLYRAAGMTKFGAGLAYRGVRIGGWLPWRRSLTVNEQ
jgi:hypothetical protein